MKTVLLFLSLLASNTSLYSQWEKVSSSAANAIIVHNGVLFAGGERGARRSTDNGNSWVTINNGLHGNLIDVAIESFHSYHDQLLVGTKYWEGIFTTSDSGNTWMHRTSGSIVPSFASNNNYIFSTPTNAAISRSIDSGKTWHPSANGFGHMFSNGQRSPTAIAIGYNGTYFFAGTAYGEIFRSSDNGDSWDSVYHGQTFPIINLLKSNGPIIYAGIDGSIYRSTDDGITWELVKNDFGVYTIYSLNGIVFAGGYRGVIRSNDNGDNWVMINDGLADSSSVYSITANEEYMFIATYSSIYRRKLFELHTTKSLRNNSLSLSAYPNPATKELTISHASGQAERVVMYDMTGALVRSGVVEGETTWDVSALSSGTYMLGIPGGKMQMVQVVK